MHTLIALIDLSRPLNGLITALSVAAGALCTDGSIPPVRLVATALSAALINAAGNAFNDLLDIDIDRINRPERPLPSQRIAPRTAGAYAAVAAAAGIAIALSISVHHALLAAAITALLVLYSAYLKTSVLWGNALVGLLSASAFPYGAMAGGTLGRSWIPAAFALLFHVGREIIKDIEDMAGDRQRGDRTLPLRWGTRAAVHAATFIYALLIGLTLLPFVLEIYGSAYLVCVAAVDLLVIYVVYRLQRDSAQRACGHLGRLLKAGMVLGLIAVALGEWTRRF